MRSARSDRRVFFLSMVAYFGVALSPVVAQKPPNSGNTPAPTPGGGGSAGSIGRSPSTNFPGSTNYPNSTASWPNTRPIFLSGRVLLDDGVQPNSDIRIERVCNGRTHLEGHTDRKGQFQFQVGQNAALDTDAADQASGGYGRPGGFGNPSMGGGGGSSNSSSNALWNCELRAAYPGYRSDVLELGSHRSSDDPNVGTIILHRLGGSAGGAVSVNTELVPKHAEKDYDKGVQLAEKGQFEGAEKHFEDATVEYPKYAIAWFALGQVQQREGNAEGARKSYEAAIAADSRYASPYDQLALLSAQGQEWEAAARYSQQAITLDAADYPSSLWYNALANFQLKKPTEAEKSVAELLRVDKHHRYPEAENLYAQLLLNKGSYAEAAVHLRAYLAIAPAGRGAAVAKEQLAKLEPAKATPGN